MQVKAHHLLWRIDTLCARLNYGLTAVAIVLAAILTVASAGRGLQWLASTPSPNATECALYVPNC